MKKLSIVILSIILSFCASAQIDPISVYQYLRRGELEKAKVGIDKTCSNEATNGQAKTWFYRGNIYLSIYLSDNPEYKKLDTNALQIAHDSYQRAIQIDSEVSNSYLAPPSPVIGLFVVGEQFYNKGVDKYKNKQYLDAIRSFGVTQNINTQFGRKDTNASYNILLCKKQLEKNMSNSILVENNSIVNNNASNCAFRNVTWGDNSSEVQSKEEGAMIVEGDGTGFHLISYNARVFNLDAILLYVFAKDSLTRARGSICESFGNKNNYIVEYSNIKDKLIEKYGKPISDEQRWKDDYYKDNPDNYGMAVSAGLLEYYSEFETDCMKIIIVLSGENSDINLSFEYISKKYSALENKVKREAEQNDY